MSEEKIEKNFEGVSIEKTIEAAERLEKANKEAEKILARQERLRVDDTLAGQSFAGGKKELTEDEKETKIAKEFLQGTGLDPFY